MEKEKEIIGYAVKKEFDFGRLSEEVRQGIIKVDENNEYISGKPVLVLIIWLN